MMHHADHRTKPVQVRMKSETHAWIHARAVELDRSANWIINKILEEARSQNWSGISRPGSATSDHGHGA